MEKTPALVTGPNRAALAMPTAIELAKIRGVRTGVVQYNSIRRGAEKVLHEIRKAGSKGGELSQANLGTAEGTRAFREKKRRQDYDGCGLFSSIMLALAQTSLVNAFSEACSI